MSAHDPDFGHRTNRGGLLHWLRRSGPNGGAASGRPAAETGSPLFLESTRERQQRQTLEDIGRFLLTHRLPITPFTLEAAHGIMTGANAQLSKLVAERVAQRDAITLHWLEDRIDEQAHRDGADQVHDLIHRLEAALGEFASTTSAARAATSDYNSALEAHAEDIEATQAMRELAALARDMIGRTREIERELNRSERETRALQKSLDDARRDAEIDHLTGLPNRRAFEAILKRQYARCRRTGTPLCVAFCDIDHFKRINDLHGHDAGDRVLRAVATSWPGLPARPAMSPAMAARSS
ncbi:diguanylate cyclase [Novosphingobium sp. BL-8A]|uniref:GGDEF domain-containing protein n=1 Tax=Novosphingobium sp. BL-8A TaxID=3127639 RepID=UPI0037576589